MIDGIVEHEGFLTNRLEASSAGVEGLDLGTGRNGFNHFQRNVLYLSNADTIGLILHFVVLELFFRGMSHNTQLECLACKRRTYSL